jgi:hypothetical protein
MQATIHVALVHGHILVAGVLLPLALAGMLFLARKVGGAAVWRSLKKGSDPFSEAP